MSVEEEKQINYSEMFWSQIKNAWPETSVVNPKDINFSSQTEVCVVLCPLYLPGKLEESKLMPYPAIINGSRVANKMNAYLSVINLMNNCISEFGGKMNLNVVFANKGVLFSGKPGKDQLGYLKHHKDIYAQFFNDFGKMSGININFFDYDDFGVQFPIFVDPKASIPVEIADIEWSGPSESKMIFQLNKCLNLPIAIEDTKKSRHAVKRVLDMEGTTYESAFWIIAGYLAFDYKIADIIGQNGIYIAAERFEPLFGIARLTKSLRELTKVQLKA